MTLFLVCLYGAQPQKFTAVRKAPIPGILSRTRLTFI